MEKQPIPHHHVYHPHIPHLPQPNVNVPLHLSYSHIDPHMDSHDQFVSQDSHNTTVEQFNFENIYPMGQHAPMAQPAPMASIAPMAHAVPCGPVCETGCQAPAKYDPPSQFQTNAVENVIVPHVHPSHTVHNMHTHVVNQHYFPHTESCCYSASCEDVFCGPPPCPCPMPGPGMHPGMYPGMHPGMAPYPAQF